MPDDDECSDEKSLKVYEILLNSLPSCAEALMTCDKPQQKEKLGEMASVSVSYFRLLNWLLMTDQQIDEFEPHFDLFMEIYHRCDRELFELDYNKFEMLKFLSKLIDGNKKYLLKIMRGGTIPTDQFLEFFISLNSNPEYVEYNNEICALFYRILRQAVSLEGEHHALSKKYLYDIAKHRNWNWATQYLLYETTRYPLVADEMIQIIQKLCQHFKSTDMMYKNIDHILRCIDVLVKKKFFDYPDNATTALNIFVQDSMKLKLYCVSKGGVEVLCRAIIHVIEKKGSDGVESIELSLHTMNNILDWVDEMNLDEDEMLDESDGYQMNQLLHDAKIRLISHHEDKYELVQRLHSYISELTTNQESMIELNEMVSRRLKKFEVINIQSLSDDDLSDDDN